MSSKHFIGVDLGGTKILAGVFDSNLKCLVSDKNKLKSSLTSIGAFMLVLVIAFLFSSGEETPLQDGEVLSASGARWVETGIRTFYFLTVIAICSMAYGSVRKLSLIHISEHTRPY